MPLLLYTFGAFAQVQFYHPASKSDFKRIVDKAEANGKQIFIDCYTSWCGPCQAMKMNVFSNWEVGSYMNSHFVCVAIDMDSPLGEEFGDALGVNSFPTFIFVNGYGTETTRRIGYMHRDAFLNAAKNAYRLGN